MFWQKLSEVGMCFCVRRCVQGYVTEGEGESESEITDQMQTARGPSLDALLNTRAQVKTNMRTH